MKLLKEKQIYQILSKLNNIGITEKYNELKKFYEYEQIGASPKEHFKGLETVFGKSNNKDVLIKFMENNEIYFSELEKEGYIKNIKEEYLYYLTFPILKDGGKIFLENYKNRNIVHRIQDFVTEYKVILGIILTIIGLIFTYLKLTN
ncbi:MAG: hypothetical protein Q9M94_07620 [Candidatus Gracilibacteria bacterium]|nr:hypothetical protein [Candidatus Gracilibacteria bacterium]MDQ7022274.1 hypothetical protein [Candidatus Gracilibacteria bacterium]